VGRGVSLPPPAATSARVGSVKFDAGFCEARVRPLLNKTNQFAEQAANRELGGIGPTQNAIHIAR
jgi:hypothetical protein